MCNIAEGIRKEEARKRGRAWSSGVRCALCSATVSAVVGIAVAFFILAAIWGLLHLGTSGRVDAPAQIISTETPPQGSPGGDAPQVMAFATTTPVPQSRNRANDLTTTAYVALQAGRYEEAERVANEALELDASFGWAIWVRDEARRRQDEALNSNLDQLLNEGWLCLNRGELTEALRKAEYVLEKRPNDFAAKELKRLAEEAQKKAPESDWANSSSRKAGARQTLKIGDAEYGFCWIPSGEFDMGSPESEEGRFDNEPL
ncbi:MAG: hypothetical protein IJL92_06160, partial [Thermoguttaceae bacterium]|nr:hypothetical protein [Thermoguttaceae bacterium]